MSLIEGIGDEVTIVFGFFILAIVLLLAWLSTHTDDLSLFREVGVIVVELSQRRTLHRQVETDEGTPELPADGETPDDQDVSNESAEPEPGEASNQTLESDESSASPPSSSGSSLITPGLPKDSSPVSHRDDSGISQPSVQDGQGGGTSTANEGEVVNDVPMTSGQEVVINNEREWGDRSAQLPLDGAEIRQRRVQYFQREEHQDCLEAQTSSSDLQSTPDNTDIRSQNLTSPEENGASFCKKSEKPLSCSGSGNSVLRETQIREDLPPSSSSSEGGSHVIAPASPVNSSSSQIRVKLRYMNETQRDVLARLDDTIGDFRRTHFQSELQDNKWVRFIFNGQDLRDDARTLQACNIGNDSTMHCLVTTQNRTQSQPEAATEDEEDSMLGTMMYPLFTILLAIVWYFRFTYRQYFSAMSTVCLIGISFILFLSYISSLRMSSDSQQPQRQSTAGATASGNNNSRSGNSTN